MSLPSHPLARRAWVSTITAAGLGVALAILFAIGGVWSFAPWGVGLAVVAVALGARRARLLEDLVRYERATNFLSSGSRDEADLLFSAVRSRALRAHVAVSRAEIALLRGDLANARALAERSQSMRFSPFSFFSRSNLEPVAHAVCALTKAAGGDADGARTHIAIVRKLPLAAATARARASVAELLLAHAAGDMERLSSLLVSERRILECAVPRERALVRALIRVVERPRECVSPECHTGG